MKLRDASSAKWVFANIANFLLLGFLAIGCQGYPNPIPQIQNQTPVITLNGPAELTVEAGTAYFDQGATAHDSEDGDLTERIQMTGSVDTQNIGDYTLSYDVSDSAGRAAETVTRRIYIRDHLAPAITLAESNTLVLDVNSSFTEPGFNATDSFEGDLTSQVVILGSVDINLLGTYPIRYNVSDSSGNAAAEQVRLVQVVDRVAPVITLLGNNPFVIEAGQYYEIPGATALDNYYGNLTNSISRTTDLNSSRVGSYSATYRVTDPSGNAAIAQTRAFNVVDTLAPQIRLYGSNPMRLEAGMSFTEPGFSAYDLADGYLTQNVEVSYPPNGWTNVVGDHTITYSVKDSSHHTAQVMRTVEVRDTLPPVIRLLGGSSIDIQAGSVFIDPGATANDLHDGDLTSQITVDGFVDTRYLNTYILTYRVRDSAFKSASVQRTVRVTPIRLCYPSDFERVRRASSIAVTQICDIDFANEPDFEPIDNFTGSFNGAGFEIRNIRIDRPEEDYVGIFRRASALFHSVRLRNIHVTGRNFVGGLVGEHYPYSSQGLQNCFVDGEVSGQDSVGGFIGYLNSSIRQIVILDSEAAATVVSINRGSSVGWRGTGGLVGTMNYGEIQDSSSTSTVVGIENVGGLLGSSGTAIITRSFATGSITGTAFVGGLLGKGYGGSINASYALGSVQSSGDNAGGLVGYFYEGTVSRSYSTGNVFSRGDYVGGLVGQTYDGSISHAYATGNVNGRNYVGGLLGYTYGERGAQTIGDVVATGDVTGTDFISGLIGGTYEATISRGLALGYVHGPTARYIGGILGYANPAHTRVNSSFWNSDTIPYSSLYGTGRNTAALQNQSTYISWDFHNIWSIAPGEFPRLR